MTESLADEKKEHLNMSVGERIKLVEDVFIKYPGFNDITDKIAECHSRSKVSAEPKCFFITGEAGCGKTTIALYYENLYPRQTTEEGAVIPILSSTLFAPATVKGLATGLLDSLGDPMADAGTITNQTLRLYHLIEKCGVQMIILDEFQHLIDRDSDTVLGVASDWLKNLLNRTRLPMVLIGLPYSIRILKTNPQLRRRFSVMKEIKAFGWETPEEQEAFFKFLKAVDDALPLKELSHINSLDTAFRLHCASRGLISNIMKVVRTAAIMAIERGVERLTPELMALSYDDEIASLYPGHPNPFLAEGKDLKPLPPEEDEPLKKPRTRVRRNREKRESIGELLCV